MMETLKKMIRKIRNLFNIEFLITKQNSVHDNQLEIRLDSMLSKILYEQRKEILIQKAYKCKEMGITTERHCEFEVVVSMATHGERFYEVYMAIESIMQQSIKPNRIILNISKEEFTNKPLPVPLRYQQKRGLEINYCEDLWSFKKIIPTLRKYPNSIIVTVDDDCLYNVDMLENLIDSYKQDPSAIWGNRIHKIKFEPQTQKICSYMKWDMCIPYNEDSSKLHFITSVGGVLYPPNSLYKDVLRDDIFMDICRTNDDVWCYVMAILNNTPIRKVRTHSSNGEDYLSVEEVQSSGLCQINTNIGGNYCKNDDIIKVVFEKYDIISKIL